MSAADHLRRLKDGKIVVSSAHMRYRLPQSYFDGGVAEWRADQVMSQGSFFASFKKTDKSKPDTFWFDLGVASLFGYSSSSKIRAKSHPDLPAEEVWELGLESGETFMESSRHTESLDGLKAFLNHFNAGRLGYDDAYSRMPDRMRRAFELNGVPMGVPAVIVEAIVGEMMRDAKDELTPFRWVAGKTGQEHGYRPASLRDLPSLNSVFSGLAFEDIKESVARGVSMTRKGGRQRETPLEDLLKV